MLSRIQWLAAIAVCSAIVLLQFGCTSAAALRGEQGKDISSVKVGLTRQEVESTLGTPEREWLTSEKIRYCVYRYDGGVPPSDGDAVAYAFINIISAGLFEFYEAVGATKLSKPSQDDLRRVWLKVAIAYDSNNRVVGIFDHFGDLDPLPADGRSKQ